MIKKIGIIGAGSMGTGIAHGCVLAGYSVLLKDISQDALAASLTTIDRMLERQVARKKLLDQEKEEALQHLQSSVDFKGFESCDLVIEAITEKKEIKENLFKDLIPSLSPQCFLATTTSSLSITSLSHMTDRPDKFIGLHFMSPVHLTSLVEVVCGLTTAPLTFQIMLDVIKRLGKEAIVSEDYPGFIVNRILMPMINEAVHILFEGVGTIGTIDKAIRLGTNYPMGPLECADLIGLDTVVTFLNVLYKDLGYVQYKPCPLLIKYVEAGWLGRKTNRGFYDYTGETPVPTVRRPYDIS